MSELSSIGIYFETVYDLIPDQNAVIYRDPKGRLGVARKVLTPDEFKKFKFEAIKWIKKRPTPEDRAWPFELQNEHGCYSYDKERQIIQQRKTRKEKEDERKEEQYWKEQFKKAGLDLSS